MTPDVEYVWKTVCVSEDRRLCLVDSATVLPWTEPPLPPVDHRAGPRRARGLVEACVAYETRDDGPVAAAAALTATEAASTVATRTSGPNRKISSS